jgi:hypothetical protein
MRAAKTILGSVALILASNLVVGRPTAPIWSQDLFRPSSSSPPDYIFCSATNTNTVGAAHELATIDFLDRNGFPAGPQKQCREITNDETCSAKFSTHSIGQEMAAHESPRTTKLYDRTKERLTQDEVERIRL